MATKEFILENAVKLFAAKGFEGVGVQEICTASDITKPTLYYYFSSKNGLLEAIIDVYGNAFFSQLEIATEYTHDFIGSLSKILDSMINFARNNPDFFRLHCALENASTESEGGKIYRPFSQKIESRFAEFFENSTAEIGNMRGKERIFSRIFLKICISTAADYSENENAARDYTEDKNSIIHAFAYGVVNG